MDKKTMILLVGCGASAAIAGIFKAPIAGLVFTLEVLMVDLSMASLLPILISCVTATCFTYILMGSKSLFDFTLTSPWALDRVPACLLLGIFCGLVSLYFMRTMSVVRGLLCQAFALSIRKTAVWWTDSEFAHLPLPFALRRGLFGSQRAAEGAECGRLGAGDEPFALLRAQPAAHPLHRLGNLYQGFCHLGNQW